MFNTGGLMGEHQAGELPLERLLPALTDQFGDSVAVTGAGGDVTYRELLGMALGLASVLRESGVDVYDNVLLLAPNSVVFVAAFFGIVMAGGTVVALSPDATKAELGTLIRASDAKAAIILSRYAGRDYVQELDEGLPRRRIEVDQPHRPSWPRSQDRANIRSRDQDRQALIAFTSGSTGLPKAACHRARTLVHTGEMYVNGVLEGEPGILISALPLYHLGGMTLIMLPALMSGGRLVLIERFKANEFVGEVNRHAVTVLMLIPAMLELLFVRDQLGSNSMPSVRTIALGGAPVSNELVRRTHQTLGAQIYVGYGQTECPGFWVLTRSDTSLDELGPLVGWPDPCYEVDIVDAASGATVPPGSAGEICVRSRFALIEYFDDPAATSAAVSDDGWFHTGDLGTVSADGALSVVGRIKEMYIRGGFNIYPREIEECLINNTDVKLAAVHSFPDAVLGERGCAWVVLDQNSTVTEEALRQYMASRLTHYKIPDVIYFVDSLPMNAIGKIDKVQLTRSHMDMMPG